ncbi:alcohol dehydrogenase catalytic domain-containing protein [Alphaproteobacteria bacterium]|nr:alcohol dehydrogenase catalytic domain-containing protein [Alphaproteobacteria bacterium]
MLTLAKTEAILGGIALIDKEPREPEGGEILMRVEAAGICGTDMQIYKWAPRMARRMKLPTVMGHEASGVVEAVGAGVTRVNPGDAISLESHIYCGECHQCLTDRAHLCTETRYPGIDMDGCFARYVVVPEQIAWIHPRPIPHTIAAMFEPLGIAVHACGEGRGCAGLSILVNGCGPIGLMAIAVARAMGAETVIAVDPLATRREAAARLGADLVINPMESAVPTLVRDVTFGRGAEVVMEFSGTPEGFSNAMESLTKGGDFRLVGAPPHPVEIDLTVWLRQCPTVFNVHGRRIWDSWDKLWALFETGAVDIASIASHHLPLSDAPRGFDLIQRGEALKPILIPG